MRGSLEIAAHLRHTFRRQQFAILQPFTQAEQAVAKPFGGFSGNGSQIIKLRVGKVAEIQFGNQRTEDSDGVFRASSVEIWMSHFKSPSKSCDTTRDANLGW